MERGHTQIAHVIVGKGVSGIGDVRSREILKEKTSKGTTLTRSHCGGGKAFVFFILIPPLFVCLVCSPSPVHIVSLPGLGCS